MIPNHILNDLMLDDRIAVLSRGGEIHFLIHPASDRPAQIADYAIREGSQVLKTHLKDHEEILAFVASRERDVGGES